MMSWCPPTPPLSPSQANDIYYDDCLDLLYDPDFMGESKLPSTLYDLHRPLQRTPSPIKKPAPPASPKNKNKTVMDLLNAATMSQYSSASVSPMSTYDSTYYPDYGYGPTDFSHANFDYQPPMKKEKRERTGKEREMALKLNRETPRPITPPTPIYEQEDYEGPEWSIVEDMWIVDAINAEEAHGHMPIRLTYALLYNWDFVAQFVNSRNGPTGHFRSPRQCCIRYQMVVRPREAGHLHTVDPLTKKPRKVPVTQIELNHLKKGRSTTRAQFEHDFPQVMENQFTSKAKLFRDLMKKNKRPQKTYADVVPPVVQTQMPESFLQRLQELKIPITTILPEDMVRKQEEIHFNVFQENRAKAGEKVAEPEPLKAQSSISVRRSAIPSTGSVDSKAPFMLELPASRPPPPPRPPAQTLHQSSSIPTLIASDHTMSTSVPRRVGSVGGSMSHMVSPSSSTHTNYVVLNSNDHSTAATLRVQRRFQRATETVGAANNAMFRPLNSAPVRRTPPTTPLTPGHPRSLNYVTQTNQSNSTSYITGQQGGSSTTIYSGASPLSQGARNVSAAVPRVVTRPGQTSRIYVNNERSAYVHMTHPSTVRVVQGNAVQRVQPPKRVAPKPAGTTVTTMVVPAGSRPTTTGPQLQQFRTIRAVQRGGGPVQGRVMVMGRPAGSVNHVVTQGGVTRQLLTSRPIASRTGSPQTIAQVVLAPSNIQQQSSNQSQPQPPTSSQSGNVQQQQQQQQQASSLPPPLVAQTQLESQGAPPERSNSQSQ